MQPPSHRAATVPAAARASSARRGPVRRPSTCRGRSRARSSARPAAPSRKPPPSPSISRPVRPPPSSSGWTMQTTAQPTPTAARVPMMKHRPPMVGRPRGAEGSGGSCPGLGSGAFSFSGGTRARSRGVSRFPTAAVRANPSTDATIKAKRIMCVLSECQDRSPLSPARASASFRACSRSTAFSSAMARLPLNRTASPGAVALARKPAISS